MTEDGEKVMGMERVRRGLCRRWPRVRSQWGGWGSRVVGGGGLLEGAKKKSRATPAPLAVLYRTATGAARPAGQERKNEKETTRGRGAECRFAPTCGHGARRMNNSEHGDSHSGLGQGAQSWVATRPRATHPSRAGLPTSNQHTGDPKRSADARTWRMGDGLATGAKCRFDDHQPSEPRTRGKKGKREQRKGESSELSRRTGAEEIRTNFGQKAV